MRKKLIAAVLISFVAMSGASALAKSPSGSSEHKKTKQVKCKGTALPAGGLTVYAGANGVEVCSGDNSAPDGRVIVNITDRYISVDGDPTNPGAGSGWARLDQSGLTCGDAKHTDSDKGGGKRENCGP